MKEYRGVVTGKNQLSMLLIERTEGVEVCVIFYFRLADDEKLIPSILLDQTNQDKLFRVSVFLTPRLFGWTDVRLSSRTAGTAYVTFDNVKVPVGNLLGKEGRGLQVILRYVFFTLGALQVLNAGRSRLQ
jgi:alkylation response protein AidB-like acyl-CoA dehydrogenase